MTEQTIFINLLPNMVTYAYFTKIGADACATEDRIACFEVTLPTKDNGGDNETV